MSEANDVAASVIAAFDALPQKAKPRTHGDGSREWIPLSGIAISYYDSKASLTLECVAIGTGMKCLPASTLQFAQGCNLHDWHAEVLALRAFNLYLLQECLHLAGNPDHSSSILEHTDSAATVVEPHRIFRIKPGVRIHMYASEAPCGDASMENVMGEMADATPWQAKLTSPQNDSELLGRGYFSRLGIVRRKPARADAPITLSKSCSDKLAMKQCTSTLSSLTGLFIAASNAYIHELILPQEQIIQSAIDRCFGPGGRMCSLSTDNHSRSGRWDDYAYKPFHVRGTSMSFVHNKRCDSPDRIIKGSNISAMWTPESQEVLIGGVMQGNKQFKPSGASACSRARMWALCLELARILKAQDQIDALLSPTYGLLKQSGILKQRELVKQQTRAESLMPWIRNTGDDEFDIINL